MTRLQRLERWSSTAFLVAGVLLLFSAIATGVELVTTMSLQGMLTGLSSFGGLIIAYIGLLGLYPRLVNSRPRLARVSIVLLLAPIAIIVFVLVYALAVGTEPPFVGPLFITVFVGFALGITLYGIASYRSETPSREVGLALLVFALSWILLAGASPIYGGAPPIWIDFTTIGMRSVALLAIGYLLRTEPAPTERTEPQIDSPTR